MANVFDVAACVVRLSGKMHKQSIIEHINQAKEWYFVWEGRDLFDPSEFVKFLEFLNKNVCSYFEEANFFDIGSEDNLSEKEKETVFRVIYFSKLGYGKALNVLKNTLLPVNTSIPIIEQLKFDIELILKILSIFLNDNLSTLKLNNFIDNFEIKIKKARSFSENIYIIENIFLTIVKISEGFAKLFLESNNKVISEAISNIHDELCLYLNMASLKVIQKYSQTSRSILENPETYILDGFIPITFSETNGVNLASLKNYYYMALVLYGLTPPPITITFRDEGYYKGAFFDHYNIQKITGRRTEISLPNGDSWKKKAEEFYKLIEKSSLKLPQNNDGNIFPQISVGASDPDGFGLMIVPGYADPSKKNLERLLSHNERIEHEKMMLVGAFQYGWIGLAICGGLWTLTEAMGGTIKPAHTHRGQMPELNLDNGDISFSNRSPHIHPLFILPDTKLAKFIGCNQNSKNELIETKALSVHWQEVDKIPKGFRFSAFATRNMKEVEAIENIDNESTIIGIQGHPEAMRENHVGLYDAAKKHHSLINNLVEEGDEYHRKRLHDKASNVNRYSHAQLMQKFGVTNNSYLIQAEEQEHRQSVLNSLNYVGLTIQVMPNECNDLFNAIAIYLKRDQQILRNICADNLHRNREKYEKLVDSLLLEEETYEQYVSRIKKSNLTNNLDLEILMKFLEKPIIVIDSKGIISNSNMIDFFLGCPIFVFYNHFNYYDALIKDPNISSKEILQRLSYNSTYRFSSESSVTLSKINIF